MIWNILHKINLDDGDGEYHDDRGGQNDYDDDETALVNGE